MKKQTFTRYQQTRWSAPVRTALEQNRLLVISPFDESAKWITAQQAAIRNRLMLDLADCIQIAYARRRGSLEGLIEGCGDKKIRIRFEIRD